MLVLLDLNIFQINNLFFIKVNSKYKLKLSLMNKVFVVIFKKFVMIFIRNIV